VWQEGIEWNHAGHTVGCNLSVHEPGVMIAPPPRGETEIMLGMLVSNEPACYWPGDYGLRLENLMLVVPTDFSRSTSTTFYQLDTVSLVPFDPSLTKLSVLSTAEKEWLAAYHTRILDTVGPLLPGPERHWLAAVTKYFC
jgi:Xaa-Pro aminopeptidase